MFCLCRSKKHDAKHTTHPSSSLITGTSLSSKVDYSQRFPTFASIFVGPAQGERNILLELQTALAQWAFCTSGQCPWQPMRTSSWNEHRPKKWAGPNSPWSGPSLPFSQWDNTVKAKATQMQFKGFNLPARDMLGTKNTLSDIMVNELGFEDNAGPMYNMLFMNTLAKQVEPTVDLAWQVMNYHPNEDELDDKDKVQKALGAAAAKSAAAAETFLMSPQTFLLPDQFADFQSVFNDRAACGKRNVWIYKPAHTGCGKGIHLVTTVDEVAAKTNGVVQYYVDNPLLVKGYKFDIRCYALVTSFSPLEAYIYPDGLARFSTTKYNDDHSDIFAHITNASIQKKSGQKGLFYDETSTAPTGCGFTQLSEFLRSEGHDWKAMWKDIKDMILKVLVCSEDRLGHQIGATRIFGFDVLLDSDRRPWFIEANAKPAMGTKPIVPGMIRGAMQILDPIPFDRVALADVVERRLNEIGKSWSQAEERSRLNQDLNRILMGRMPRQYGFEPASRIGDWELLAPCSKYLGYKKILNGN